MHNKTIEQTLSELGSGKNGLSQTEADLRLKKFGKNELDKAKRQSFIKCFLKQFLNIMVGILFVAAVVSISIALIKKQYEDLFEGFVILFIVIVNALIGVFQENKAQNCLDDLQKMCLTNVKVLRGGAVVNVDSTMLVPGDVVLLEAGNIVMADVRLIETNNFSCDESSLTGESVPVEKMADVCLTTSTPLAERKNMAYSGSLVTNGKAKGVVIATGKTSELGKIANILFTQKKEVTPLQKSIDKIGKIITWSVLLICAVILVVELVFGNNFLDAVMTSVALAVAAIPESLPAVITIILALGVQQLAKRKCIIKHLNAVETLGSCEIICTDKTGTLTMNKMQVVETWLNDAKNLTEGITFEEFKNCMQLCNNAKQEAQKVVGEPTEVALMEYAIKFGKINKKIIHEIPFSSARKMMTVVTNENGIKCYSKGAPERILEHCTNILINGQVAPLTEDLKNKIKAQNNKMSDEALRVIAFAYKKLDAFNPNDNLEHGMVFLGLCGMMDNPRPEVKESVQKCFKAGLKPIMITGDHKRTAFAIAKKIGITEDEKQVITGEELDTLTDAELKKHCYNYTVYARVSPEHKVRIVKEYKGINKIVAMTG
ncbi:MAG: HAD-IC family P-type ATPase, partial [Clostridia bacterium]|nr:HAD-IC family P-type ATPase [Clostridia bacterium]